MNSSQSNFIALVYGNLFINASKDVKEFIACQFALESNFGLSSLSTDYNNISGMKVVEYRCNNQIPPGDRPSHIGFGCYSSLADCILDYCYWLCFNRCSNIILHRLHHFKAFLVKSHYCPDVDYIDRIDKLYVSFQNFKQNGKN